MQIKLEDLQSYINSLQNDIFMVFLVAIGAGKSVAEKSVLDSLGQQHCGSIVYSLLSLAAVALQFITYLCKALINVTIYSYGN